MDNNLKIYNEVRAVPKEAQKEIKGGRIGGFTDINPMWRIKTLTEQFGPCGIGWKYTITDKRTLEGANGNVSAFVDIDLFYKMDGEWSDAVPGTGGSSFVAKEKNGLYTSDECFKMALTDAISISCKALGIGANIYWDKDTDKYTKTPPVPDTSELDAAEQTARQAYTEIRSAYLKQKDGQKLLDEFIKLDINEVGSIIKSKDLKKITTLNDLLAKVWK